jgi:hypothetical protein
MRHPISLAPVLLAIVACVGPLPPPPDLTVSSPQRGMVQNAPGQVTVTGIALPGPSGDPVARVTVNGKKAMLERTGEFSVTVDVPEGASLIETVALSSEGAKAIDARAIQIGERRAVGTTIERAFSASLSADAFAKLAASAGPLVKGTDFTTLLAPMQPMASLGNSVANAKVSITKLSLGDVKLTLVPVDGGLQFTADLTTLSVGASAKYDGALVPAGTVTVGMTADKITIGGTLTVTPSGTAGFTTKITSPIVKTTNLKLQASGVIGDIVDLLQDNLSSMVNGIITRSAEKALDPIITKALGALAGPQRIAVMGKTVEFQVSPAAVLFSRDGGLVTLNILAKIDGSESSPGFVYTQNGTPKLDLTSGVHVALADDLINEMLAEIHALGVLNYHLDEDFGVFDSADFQLTMPPMISANNTDGTFRLVLGDMVASFSDHGTPVITAAINAQIDLEIERGTTDKEIALDFGKVQAYVNVIKDPEHRSEMDDMLGAANAGIGVQLDSLSKFMVTLPLPELAGMQLDGLALRADSGYLVASGQIH